MRQLIAIMTCHNRRERTLACVGSLRRVRVPDGYELNAIVVDDGSTDLTAQAVRDGFPSVVVIEGSGDLYWNGGMRVAFREAARRDPWGILFVNDDVTLHQHALSQLLETYEQVTADHGKPAITVGSLADPNTAEVTYGGRRRSPGIHPLHFDLVESSTDPEPCDTFNANFVLVGPEAWRRVGNLSEHFTHSFGDYDYGLRASEQGCGVWVAPGVVGECERDDRYRPWNDTSRSLAERLRSLTDVKVEPIGERLLYCRQHGGSLWPIWWLAPYIRVVVNSLLPFFGERSRFE